MLAFLVVAQDGARRAGVLADITVILYFFVDAFNVLVQIASFGGHVAAEVAWEPDALMLVALVLADQGLAGGRVCALVAVVDDALVARLLVSLDSTGLGRREVAKVAAISK